MADTASKYSEEAFSKMKAKLAKVQANWAWERERAESKLAKTKKEVAEVVEKFKASKDFTIERARIMANF